MYKYDKISERLEGIFCKWYELGVPIIDIIRRFNPKLRAAKLPQFDMADFCFYVLTLSKSGKINIVKRTLSDNKDLHLEYDSEQMKKYIKEWTEGGTRDSCHDSTGSKIYDTYKFGNRLFACLNKKYKVSVVDTSKKSHSKKNLKSETSTNQNRCVYTIQEIEELENTAAKEIRKNENLKKTLAIFFSLIRLMRINSKTPNAYAIAFEDIPLNLRTVLINEFPFMYNTFSYPERMELKEFKDGWDEKNSKSTRMSSDRTVSLQQAEKLLGVRRRDTDKEVTREVLSGFFPKLTMARELLQPETTADTEKRMTILNDKIIEGTSSHDEFFPNTGDILKRELSVVKKLADAEEKIKKAGEITEKSLEIMRYKTMQEAKGDKELMDALKEKELKEMELMTREIDKINEDEDNENTKEDATLLNDIEVTLISSNAEEETLKTPESPAPQPASPKTKEEKKKVAEIKNEAIEEERSIPLSERLKKMKTKMKEGE